MIKNFQPAEYINTYSLISSYACIVAYHTRLMVLPYENFYEREKRAKIVLDERYYRREMFDEILKRMKTMDDNKLLLMEYECKIERKQTLEYKHVETIEELAKIKDEIDILTREIKEHVHKILKTIMRNC